MLKEVQLHLHPWFGLWLWHHFSQTDINQILMESALFFKRRYNISTPLRPTPNSWQGRPVWSGVAMSLVVWGIHWALWLGLLQSPPDVQEALRRALRANWCPRKNYGSKWWCKRPNWMRLGCSFLLAKKQTTCDWSTQRRSLPLTWMAWKFSMAKPVGFSGLDILRIKP